MKLRNGWSVRTLSLSAGLVLLCAALAAVIVPRWRAFVEADNAQTCYDARYWTAVRYELAVREALADGADARSLDYEQILRDAAAEYFTYELTEDLTSPDLCRGGGTCSFSIDPQTHTLTITCTQEGHEEYDSAELADESLEHVIW